MTTPVFQAPETLSPQAEEDSTVLIAVITILFFTLLSVVTLIFFYRAAGTAAAGIGRAVLSRVAVETDSRAGPATPQNPPLRYPPTPPATAKSGCGTEQGQPVA